MGSAPRAMPATSPHSPHSLPERADQAVAPVAAAAPRGAAAYCAHLQRTAGNRATGRILQRVLQVRPPGRGEASAFDRRQELIDRLNRMAPGMEYFLAADDRTIGYVVIDEAFLTPFDRRMRDFIDQAAVIPMRLINRTGFVAGEPLRMDSLELGYVDLDDLLSLDGPRDADDPDPFPDRAARACGTTSGGSGCRCPSSLACTVEGLRGRRRSTSATWIGRPVRSTHAQPGAARPGRSRYELVCDRLPQPDGALLGLRGLQQPTVARRAGPARCSSRCPTGDGSRSTS